MPVFFYLDPDLLNDLNMIGIETVTLSYTFFSKFLTQPRWREVANAIYAAEAKYANNGKMGGAPAVK